MMIRRAGDAVRTSPMLPGRCGARVASRQSSVLHNGTSSLTMICISSKNPKELSRLDMMKDLEERA